jgi:hypothetical protein
MSADEVPPPREPVALYEGPKLRWFRGWALVVVVASAVAFGVGLDRALLVAQARLAVAAQSHPTFVSRTPAGVLRLRTLRGPGGVVEELPPRETSVVHVWLEGCADCMPAFAAIARLRDDPRLAPLPTLNVAYGTATPDFAARYGVDRRLVQDADGRAVVQPLGIGSFTTLVVAPNGRVVLMDRPDRDGYVDRVVAAYRAADALTR